ncbi:MAG: YndJ family transporter [Opitutales bacterium]
MTTRLKVRIGAIAWCVFAYLTVPGLNHANWPPALIMLSALVLAPLAWCLARDDRDAGMILRLRQTGMVLQLPGALLLCAAFVLPAGPRAMACTLVWTLALASMALVGVMRIGRRGPRPVADLVRDAGLVYALVGGAWLLADRAGLQLLGFDPVMVIVAAGHFHFAGLVLPIVGGTALARRPTSRLGQVAAWGVIFGVPLVAAGYAATHFGWDQRFETTAMWLLVASGFALAVLHLQLAASERTAPRASRVFWALAGVMLAGGMVLAGLYASRGLSQPMPWLDLPGMRTLHGTLNPVGFSLAALLGWCRAGRCCQG